ncbi:hypothetical protein A2V80_00185 [Candidatus Woesebacteria bacterium RBG_16_39_8b]|uniref:O-antigen ligase-related domain-containing protein n=1 Tax=Candidatus Woesebacteria bacterium RBG_16_39_8b TaxID=1802482 RepID=A0A1F7XC73_9BACT|nr:MAG: hypothetical protein A2V80_00185 [Candidatus Woesebacteria bacterium RBG_16_39_8b]
MKKITNIITGLYCGLFFFVPLILVPITSELFEFNKLILVYLVTLIVISLWIAKMIIGKKILFRRTLLDIPILLFIATLLLSTLASVDIRTSIFGYYSRFNGGLLSIIAYAALYWAYVTHMDKNNIKKSINFLLASALFVSVYGVLQHLGVDKDIWVQDVQTRVFSTLGQPNWLAAWLVAVLPIMWAFAIRNSKFEIRNLKESSWIWILLSALFFLTLLYTGSRSGLLGFAVAHLVFWGSTLAIKGKGILKPFLIINFLLLIVTMINGTLFTPSISELLKSKITPINQGSHVETPTGPALEVGGTESGEIRKIVWRGAFELWKKYPILGTGVETFAFTYYNVRPIEHNLVSEWEYLYNKAHNEYLNYAATTGSIGLLSYLTLIIFMCVVFLKSFQSPVSSLQSNKKLEYIALFSGWISILVTNFFGFSVVPVSLLFFLYPAFALRLAPLAQGKLENNLKASPISIGQKISLTIVLLLTTYFLLLIGRYWYADYLYAKGKLENDSGNYVLARDILDEITMLSSKEAIFWDELSQATTQLALSLYEEGDNNLAQVYAQKAIDESRKSIQLSPANVNLKRTRASMFIKLSALDINYLINAKDTLVLASLQAPTDAQLMYNLALSYVRIGEVDKALSTLEKTVEIKRNYRNAWFGLALLHIDLGEKEKAIQELEYILENIDENDTVAKQELEELVK